MKRLLLLILVLVLGTNFVNAQVPDTDDVPELNWSEKQWKDYMEQYKDLYDDDEADKMTDKAYEWAKENGVNTSSIDKMFESVADEIAGNIADELLEQYGAAFLQELMNEVGLARVLDEAYEEVLKKVLPKQKGIIVFDPLLKKGIEDKNKDTNDEVMLKSAIENWLNQKWKKHTSEIYAVQRGDVEYLKVVGLIRMLKMSNINWDNFVSLEIQVPDQVLNYANQVKDIYSSAQNTYEKGKDLYAELNMSVSDLELPGTLQQYQLVSNQVLNSDLTTWEMINQRKKSLAVAYNQLAERAKERANDLQNKIKDSDHFKMSEAERLKAQAIANDYMQDFLNYKKKADDLIQSSIDNEGVEKKDAYMSSYQKYMRLKNLAEQ